MVALHAFLALLAGFVTMAVLIAVITALLQKFTPGWIGEQRNPKPGYAFVNLGYSFLAASAGGYVTAWIAEHNPLIHVLALAITVLLLAAISAAATARTATRLVHAHAGCDNTFRRIGRRLRPTPRSRHPLSDW